MTASSRPSLRARRIYDPPDPDDGTRILVDRLWPRGLSRERAAVDSWEREIAPSSELRKWYAHTPSRYAEFCRRYRTELEDQQHAAALDRVRTCAAQGTVTLLTATRDIDHSHVPILITVIASESPSRSD